MDLRKQKPVEIRKKNKSFLRKVLTILGAVFLTTVLTTIAVDATDNLGNFSDSIIGGAIAGVFKAESNSLCPAGMSLVSAASGDFCIDTFESSPSADCEFSDPENQNQSTINLEKRSCKAVSEKLKIPWSNVARHQAELACANAGKHLPSNEEWYLASLGTPDARGNVERKDCNINSGGVNSTGSNELCSSSYGAYDMVGNVWEWVSESVVEGKFGERVLPDEGYVTSIDNKGVPITTNATTSDQSFNEDYLSIDKTSTRGMIRGGYFGNGTDAGQYAINAITPTSFTGNAVGFRCAK